MAAISAASFSIHYESVDDDASVTRFTNLTVSKCLEYSKEWIKIDFESQCVAEWFQSCVNQLEENEVKVKVSSSVKKWIIIASVTRGSLKKENFEWCYSSSYLNL